MPFTATVDWRWAGRLAGVLVVGIFVWLVSPNLFSAGEKGENLRPELALVPSDAFLFVHVRPADAWDNDAVVRARKLIEEFTKKKDNPPIDPADVESVSLVGQSAQVFAKLFEEVLQPAIERKGGSKYYKKDYKKEPTKKSSAEYEKPPAEQDKRREPAPEVKEKLKVSFQPAAGEKIAPKPAPAVPGILVIVTMKKPCDEAKITDLVVGKDAKKSEYNGKSYLCGRWVYLHFSGTNIFVVATSEADMKTVLDRPENVRAQGLQAAALNLAMKKHHFVVGVNLTEPTYLEEKNRLAKQLRQPERWLDLSYPRDPVWMLVPLLETQSATLTVDLGKEHKVRVQANFTYADAERAADAIGALQDALVMGRVFTLGHLINELSIEAGRFDELAVATGDAEDHRQDASFLAMLLKQADTALREATIERRQATVRFQAEGQFDFDGLRTKAMKAVPKYVPDEATRQTARRKVSANNLKKMMLGMHIHQKYQERLPAAARYTEDGKPLLSWHVWILPYIGELPLFQEFNIFEPWDSPHNIKLLPRMPKIYAPVGVKTKEPFTTFYQVIVGKGTAFELIKEKEDRFARGLKLGSDFPDGTSNTIGIVEASDPVPWTKPADLNYDAEKPLPKLGGTLFADGFNCALMDGTVRFISSNISEKTLRTAITRNGGEVLGSDW